MLEKSNTLREARSRISDHNIKKCPYSTKSLHTTKAIKAFNSLLRNIVSDEYKAVIATTEFQQYLISVCLIHGLFPYIFTLLESKKEKLYESVSKCWANIDEIRSTVSKYILFVVLEYFHRDWILPTWPKPTEAVAIQWNHFVTANNQISNLSWGNSSPHEHFDRVFKQSLFYLAQTHPRIAGDGKAMKDILYSFLGNMKNVDRSAISWDALESFDNFTNTKPDTIEDSLFCKILDRFSLGIITPYAIIWGIAESFSQQNGFQALSLEDKKAMFFSVRQELLHEAMHWSRLFAKDNPTSDTLLRHSPKDSTYEPELFTYNFDQKAIYMDGTEKHKSPIWPWFTYKWCPGMAVKIKWTPWNFVSSQIDMALEIYWENYLSKI